MKQQTFFDVSPIDSISINDVALTLNVSSASVRNWIKTGYLEKAGRGSVTCNSFRDFQADILGDKKLNKRANKTLKDQHDHTDLEGKIVQAIASPEVKIEALSDMYESSLSESFKNKEGIFYTPPKIVKVFFDYLPKDCSDLTFCDPCCGTGNFLVEALRRGFKPSNVYGFDVDRTAVAIAKKRVESFEKGSESKVEIRNFLDFASSTDEMYDVALTNPPWGKKLPKSEKESLAKSLSTGSSKDTSAIFFFACLNILKPSGYLGFLLQDAFFNIASYESARQAALGNRIISLLDFGKPFKGLVTKAKGMVLRKEKPNSKELTLCVGLKGESQISQRVFEKNPKSIFNFTCSEQDLLVIEYLLNTECETLYGRAQWGLGIVTGSNKELCSPEKQSGYFPVYKGSDISKSGLKKPSTYIPSHLSQYQQVAPIALYQAKEKLIYKFISSSLVFAHDVKQMFFLNSVNMLILHKDFPITHKQLSEILNSRLMTWLFQKLFDTHKILRADLESLPIFTGYFAEYKTFCEKTFLDYLSLEEVSGGTYRIKGQDL